ncbi:MAG: insulinase family protein [Treponema sp.]|nr:insulinase family protein [Treponema sp.]
MKKKTWGLRLFFILLVTFSVNARPSENVAEFRLENGLDLFLLEDNSTPIVRIEYCVRAGFSSQTKDNAGYFKLYSRLIEANAAESNPPLNFLDVQCNSDASRYIVETTAPGTEQTLSSLADAFFENDFSDQLVTEQHAKMKQEVRDNLDDPSGFLNAAIDSRIFSGAPWKHDSGVYLPLFTKIQKNAARAILNTIRNKWYTPQNSALFISGNIKQDEILNLVQAYFGDYYSSSPKPLKKKEEKLNTKKRFVIHDKDFSKEMTQIVIQYINQSPENCDLAAAALNSDYSKFKNNLLIFDELNIPGYEYINAASVQNEDNARLIIQSIMELPSSKKSKISSADQIELFLQTTKEAFSELSVEEFYAAKETLLYEMEEIELSSVQFMDKLSSFWAIEPYYKSPEEAFEENTKSITTDELLSRNIKIKRIIQNEFIDNFLDEDAFVFVVINSADYKKNKKKYDKLGFEEITKKNAVWYNQAVYKKIIEQADEETLLDIKSDYQKAGNSVFYTESMNQIKKELLKNGINVTSKRSQNFSKMTLLISIEGGQLYPHSSAGFEEIMIHLLTANIQNECFKQAALFKYGMPKINFKCEIASSYITVECAKEDFESCCNCICNTLIYGTETPAIADRIVAAKQYQKRLYNGSAVNQLYEEAVKKLYPGTPFISIFDAQNDILEGIHFQQIMNEYPGLLDASRYSLIITGDFPEDYISTMNQTFGLLTDSRQRLIFPEYKAQNLKNKEVSVKIKHTFLTDIPAEEAPPMPAILIPTKEFLDPVMYILKAPPAASEEAARFNALLIYFTNVIQNQIEKKKDLNEAAVSLQLPRSQMDSAVIIIKNIQHVKEADELYKESLNIFKEELAKADTNTESHSLVEKIREAWTLSQMELTASNTGTAILLQKGLEYFPRENKTEAYLEEFKIINESSQNDFLESFRYLEEEALLKLYSRDSKK